MLTRTRAAHIRKKSDDLLRLSTALERQNCLAASKSSTNKVIA
jgi:hypothetical protein